MPEIALAKALSSELSWKILDLLMKEDMRDDAIIKSLEVSQKVAGSQLRRLTEAGLVEIREKSLRSGTETTMYHLTGKAKSLEYPPRAYQHLCEALISSLVESLGQDGARMVLRDIGRRIGEETGRNLTSMTGSTIWDAKLYSEIFINRFLRQMGVYPALKTIERKKLVYEQSNCLFQELADKMPGLICDTLDEAVHDGIDKSLGVRTTRIACKGHGDPSCLFCVAWK